MVIGEDKSKVYNIVKDNIQHFRILYSNILRDCPQVVYKPQQGKLEVKMLKTLQREGQISFFVFKQQYVLLQSLTNTSLKEYWPFESYEQLCSLLRNLNLIDFEPEKLIQNICIWYNKTSTPCPFFLLSF